MIRATRALLLAAFPVLFVAACRPAAMHAVPASEEPRHHLVYANEFVHVMDIRVPAGDTTLWHIHAYPLIVVHLRNARTWDQTADSTPGPVEAGAPVPGLTDNWSRAQPYTHRVGNADTAAFHYLAAEWLKSSGVKCDSLPDTPLRRMLKAGPTAIVYELHVPPHATIPSHTHACPGIMVQATAGTVVLDAPAPLATGGFGEGQWTWHAAARTHEIRNDGATDVTVYEIDWR